MTTRRSRNTLVLLVRHGETPTTGRVLPGRAPGLHLSGNGARQAASVAARLGGVRLQAVYSSPLERARETAEPTASAHKLAVTVADGLTECDFGEWTGAELTALARRKEWQTVQRTPSAFRFPGGESFVEMQARMVHAVDRIRAAHLGGTVACFSHADPIKVALAHALGTHLDLFQRIVVAPGSVSAIWFPELGAPSVLTLNSTGGDLNGLRPS